MSFPVTPTSELFRALDAMLTARYPSADTIAKCHLFTNNITPDSNSTVESFDEAAYVGYATANVVMSAATLNDQGMCTARSGLIVFNRSGGTTPVTVYGVFITNSDSDEVIGAQRFDVPQVAGGEFPTTISGVWRLTNPQSSYGWLDAEA